MEGAIEHRYISFGFFSGQCPNQQHQAVREPTAGAVVDIFHIIIITLLLAGVKGLNSSLHNCYNCAFRGLFGMFYHCKLPP